MARRLQIAIWHGSPRPRPMILRRIKLLPHMDYVCASSFHVGFSVTMSEPTALENALTLELVRKKNAQCTDIDRGYEQLTGSNNPVRCLSGTDTITESRRRLMIWIWCRLCPVLSGWLCIVNISREELRTGGRLRSVFHGIGEGDCPRSMVTSDAASLVGDAILSGQSHHVSSNQHACVPAATRHA